MLGPGFLDLPSRSGKLRRTGITHVLDRGLPLAQATDLLERCASYVDVWKFGWSIAYLDPQLAAKLDLLAQHRVLACSEAVQPRSQGQALAQGDFDRRRERDRVGHVAHPQGGFEQPLYLLGRGRHTKR